MSATHHTIDRVLTIGEAAERIGAQTWRLQRLIARGLFPEPQRIGRTRVVLEDDLPAIAEAMRQAGYLKTTAPQTDAG
jgi:hypothetical protein